MEAWGRQFGLDFGLEGAVVRQGNWFCSEEAIGKGRFISNYSYSGGNDCFRLRLIALTRPLID